MKRNQNGIAHLGILLLLVIVAVVAFAGYKVVKDNQKTVTSNVSQTASISAQTIKNKADLNSAEASLNSQNIDGDLNPGQFDQDVTSLL
jgi:type II secretory pathway component PulK